MAAHAVMRRRLRQRGQALVLSALVWHIACQIGLEFFLLPLNELKCGVAQLVFGLFGNCAVYETGPMHARDTHVPHALSTTKPGGPLGELVVVVATRLHGQGQRLTCLTTSGPKCPSRFRCQLTQAAMPARSCPTCRNHPHSGTSSPYGWHASTRTRRASSPPLHPLTNNRASIQLSCPRQRSVEDSAGCREESARSKVW